MNGLIEKLDMNEVLIVESMNDAQILINKNTAKWVAISISEYEKYLEVKEKKNYEFDSEARQVILKLLVNGVISFKDNNIKSNENWNNLTTKIKAYYAPTPYCNLNCAYCFAKAKKIFAHL